MKKRALLALSLTTVLLILGGCGGGGDSVPTDTVNGQLIDSFIKNADYVCSDGEKGTTDENGSFSCTKLPVTFSIGGLKLGNIGSMPKDNKIFPQDLVGVDRNDTNDSSVVAMARFLQSCDEDKNSSNGIQISQTIKDNLKKVDEVFDENNLTAYTTEANITLDVNETEAISHLEKSVKFVEEIDKFYSPHQNGNYSKGGISDTKSMQTEITSSVSNALLTQNSTLSQELKNSLSHMGNEERLAHDVYMELYKYWSDKGVEIKQLYNIANNSETRHIKSVELLVKKYITSLSEFSNIDAPSNLPDANLSYLDEDIEKLPSGHYNISAIQDLYDTLLNKGKSSQKDALEVGCMVEVTDIDDLDRYINEATDSNASDVKTVFEFLRDGSYSHYRAFDTGLKNLGVENGCCSIGDKYCHPEYPNSSQTKQQKGKHR